MTDSRRRLFWAIVIAIDLGALAVGLLVCRQLRGSPQGPELNAKAWEASFAERGLPVPPGGPREGYWGSRLWGSTVVSPYRKIAANIRIPALLDIDKQGLQHYVPTRKPWKPPLIIGSSAAFGAYASIWKRPTSVDSGSRWPAEVDHSG